MNYFNPPVDVFLSPFVPNIKPKVTDHCYVDAAWFEKHMGRAKPERTSFPLQIKQTDHLPSKIGEINSRMELTFHFLRILSAFYLTK